MILSNSSVARRSVAEGTTPPRVDRLRAVVRARRRIQASVTFRSGCVRVGSSSVTRVRSFRRARLRRKAVAFGLQPSTIAISVTPRSSQGAGRRSSRSAADSRARASSTAGPARSSCSPAPESAARRVASRVRRASPLRWFARVRRATPVEPWQLRRRRDGVETPPGDRQHVRNHVIPPRRHDAAHRHATAGRTRRRVAGTAWARSSISAL